jgi:diguanylate cyclase (GGDEF)-like protein
VVRKRAVADRTGILLTAIVVAVAILGLTLPNVPMPRLALFGPLTFFTAVLADFTTAIVLLATWTSAPSRRSTLVLALSFAASATFILLAMLVLPLMPAVPPVVAAPAQSGIWLFIFWHVAISAGALIYVGVRRSERSIALSRRFSAIAFAVTVAVVGAGAIAALAFGDHLPVLAAEARLATLFTKLVGPLTAVLMAFAAVVVFRIEKPSRIDRALAIALLALTLDTALLSFGGLRYTALFYAGKALLFFGTSFVLISAVQTLLASRVRLAQVEWALSKAELESSRRAGRIRAVWKIASHLAPADPDRFSTILAIATEALRPGMPMMGLLSHLEGENVVIDSVAWSGAEAEPASGYFHPGDTFPFDLSLQSLLSLEGTTLAWDDLSYLYGRGMLFEERGWQSFIGTPVSIARRTYFVTFASQESTLIRPFAEDDIAYVDVVASFFSSRFTEQQQYERIKFQIEHDALTGLENRVQFRKAVRDEIANKGPFAIAFVDLDGFRHINESEGHQIGDEVLVEVGSGLTSVDEGNLVARMSADEFGVLIRGEGSADVDAALDRYGELFRAPFHTGDRNGTQTIGIGASIGAARFPEDGRSVEELMRRADVALTVAKERGGSTSLLFERPMEAILEETHLRVVELSAAIAHDRLALVYQPTFDLATRKIVGAEALVRWDHPERGRILPAEFVDFAERNGLIGSLSEWVFAQVVRDLKRAQLPAGARVYFNLSPRMLDDIPFITGLNETLRANPQVLEHLGVEVTETAAMQNVERSMHTIDLFRRWGLTVAIDDFGTGYSSLAYLKHLTVDMIKVDRSFITGLPEDERDCALADMLLQITDRFGFATLAEGIETEAQATWLLEHGCRLGQGYLISKPHSYDDLLARLGVLHAA